MRRFVTSLLLSASLLTLPLGAQMASAVTFNQPAQAFPAAVTTTFPDPNGWNVSGLLHGQGISAAATMDVADRQDTALTIDIKIEYTSDPNGSTGWQELVGEDWGGGLQKDGSTPHAAPAFGPYQTSDWNSLGIKRLRVSETPSRTVNNMSWSVSAN